MISKIIKRDGTVEDFNPDKLNRWGIWASEQLGRYVDWSAVVLHVASTSPSVISSVDLQRSLISYCLTKPSWAYNRMAGRLRTALLYKELYNGQIPTIKDLFGRMVKDGIMSATFYSSFSDEDYADLEKVIKHDRDFEYASYQIEQSIHKFALRDRARFVDYESPQFSMMRVAMQMCLNKGKGKARIARIKKHYDKYSQNKVNIPTPYFTNSGTDRLGLASCCLHRTKDDIGSLATGNHISYIMTVNSAGQGNKIYTRSEGDPIRGGLISHMGKKPYYRAEVAMVNANLQNGRGGAETQSFDWIDPEAPEILTYKNPMTPVARQVRGLDYAMCFNKFFVRMANEEQDVHLFSFAVAPELYEALASKDQDLFEELYHKAVAEGKSSRVVNARSLLISALSEGVHVGRIYTTDLSEANIHTPFKDPIYLSNLCQEIFLPTSAYSSVLDLYLNKLLADLKTTDSPVIRQWLESEIERVEGEVAMCSLGAINVGYLKGAVGSPEWDKDYAESCWVSLDMIHTAITESSYPLPHIEYTARKRMSAGVGIVDLAHLLAKNKVKYSTQEGRDLIHEVAESHYWFLLNASLELSKEFGVCEWVDKTLWKEGWLPTDTYNKHVDEVVTVPNKRDWEGVRKRVIDNGGHLFSCLVAHMPSESSSIKSGATNGVYPVRLIKLKKSSDTNSVSYVVPESDRLEIYYELAYDIDVEDLAKVYGIIQKWTDQGISADMYYRAQGNTKIASSDLLRGFFAFSYYGVKSRYYLNVLTGKSLDLDETGRPELPEEPIEISYESEADCESCKM